MSHPITNRFPTIEPVGARIAVISGSPGRDEEFQGLPLVGESGRLLRSACENLGLVWDRLFLGNVCLHKPESDFSSFDWNGFEVQGGIEQLRQDLEKFRPTMVLCLGNEALHLFKHGNVAPRKTKAGYDWPSKVGDWRGSLFLSNFLSPSCVSTQAARAVMVDTCSSVVTDPDKRERCGSTPHGLKILSTFHPAAVVRDYGLQAYLKFDLKRLIEESKTRELVLPKREVRITRDLEQIRHYIRTWRWAKVSISIDIEGGPGDITSIAFSLKRDVGIVIPLAHVDGSSVWSETEEIEVWQAIKDLLQDPAVPKIGQTFLYDSFALAWTYGIVTVNIAHDTMILWWELMAELKKGLATQASILTKEPFYKPDVEDGQLVFESDEQFWRYNGLDACVTFECWEREMEQLQPGQRRHYEFNMSLIPCVLFMELHGMRVDKKKVKVEQAEAERGAFELQAKIDLEASRSEGRDSTLLFDLYHGELDEQKLAGLALAQLCGKVPREKREVTEERWQPMKWNGKKWVKDGKVTDSTIRILCSPVNEYVGDVEPSPSEITRWLKPAHKTKLKLVPVTAPASLKDLDPHVLDSNKNAWRRVKQTWKEILNEIKTDTDGAKALERNGKRQDDSQDCSRVCDAADQLALDGGEGPLQADQHDRRPDQLGKLSSLLGLAINIFSTSKDGDAQVFLYEICGHKAQFKKVKGRKTDALSTDQNALDALYAQTQDVRVLWCLQQRRLKKVVTDLDTETDPDGRWRSSISLVKETGRMAMSGSPTGTGLNLQALNKDLRGLCVADEGCELAQCDLEGADSWTVAAECAACGDETMLLDLRAGLKPAKILCLVFLGLIDATTTRDQIKALLKTTKMPEWLYPGMKASVHGSCYKMGWKTMLDTVLKFSMADLPLKLEEAKPLVLTKSQVEGMQRAVYARYPGLEKQQEAVAKNMMQRGYIETSAGHVRRFYGRKVEWKRGVKAPCHETWKEALASKPQFYTTYATKRMLAKLWYDLENRRADGSLTVSPLLAVHDAAVTQHRKTDGAFARAKLKAWFENPIEIAGQIVTIPADGTIGKDWSMKESEKL